MFLSLIPSRRQWYTIIPDTVIQRALRKNEDIFRPIFLAGKGGESVSITFLDDKGNERSISVQKTGNYEDRLSVAINCLLHDGDDYQNFYSCMLDDRCGYLQITSECYDALGDNISAIKKGISGWQIC